MRSLLETYQPLRAPDDPGGGGAAAAATGAAGAGATGAGDGGGVGGGAAAGAVAAGDGSNAAAAAQPYRPQGMADQYVGKSDRETIDHLYKAVDGYRQRDAQRAVPDKAEAYAQFDMAKLGADVPEAVKGHLPGLAKDPAFLAAAEAFKAAGVPVAAMQPALLAAYKAMDAAGLLEAPVDAGKERAALLPDAAKALPKDQQDAAIDARLQANEDFIKLMMKPGADGKAKLDKAVGENALLMLMDTAAGNQFLEFVQGLATGAGVAQPNAGAGAAPSGQGARDQLKARMAEMEGKRGTAAWNQADYDTLLADYRKTIPG